MDDSQFTLRQILDLLFSAGYVDATKPDMSSAEKLTGGLAWCIAAVNSSDSSSQPDFSHGSIIENAECIEEALQLAGCPHTLQLSQIQNLQTEFIFPVIQWLVMRLRLKQEGSEVAHSEHPDEKDGQHTRQLLMQELEKTKISMKMLNENLVELNHQKLNVVNELDHLKERINEEGADAVAQKLISLMKSLKDLERQEIHFCSNRDARHSELQAEVRELEGKVANDSDSDSESLSDGLHNSLCKALERLHLDKKELAGRLRDIVAIKRQIDDLPCQSELIQYERRFSELNAQIQGKHRQTRKYYATYNALLERKELMLKETSLLNSIISQFQEAFSSADGRMKLMNSMEGIVKGSQQKLGKIQLGLQEEEKIRNDLKERYAAAVGRQKRCYSLLKAFQEECKKNEKLRCQSSK